MSSALQPIAVAYVVAAYLSSRSVRAQIATAAVILVGYALLLAFVPAPGIPAGTYEPNHNLVTVGGPGGDRPRASGGLGNGAEHDSDHLDHHSRPALRRAADGRQVFALQREGHRPDGSSAAWPPVSRSVPFVPVIMKLWTTSYGLMSAGWACLLFLAFYWTIDVLGYRGGLSPWWSSA